ncbi:MAG: hypothetical protein SWX82_05630 [Cyanobacteriota bacterium]|nr:hypothetical protein [Cyanobacteriota bacterium]
MPAFQLYAAQKASILGRLWQNNLGTILTPTSSLIPISSVFPSWEGLGVGSPRSGLGVGSPRSGLGVGSPRSGLGVGSPRSGLGVGCLLPLLKDFFSQP